MGSLTKVSKDFDERFHKVLEDVLEGEVGDDQMDISLWEIGFNSIIFVKFIVSLEDEFETEFEELNLAIEDYETLSEVKRNIKSSLKG